jgi:Ca2+-binding EF-hand superfamily protein
VLEVARQIAAELELAEDLGAANAVSLEAETACACFDTSGQAACPAPVQPDDAACGSAVWDSASTMAQLGSDLRSKCLEIGVVGAFHMDQSPQDVCGDPKMFGVCGDITIQPSADVDSSRGSIVTVAVERQYLFTIRSYAKLSLESVDFTGRSVALIHNTEHGTTIIFKSSFTTSADASEAAMDPVRKCCVLGLIRNEGNMQITTSTFSAIKGRAIFSSIVPGSLHPPHLGVVDSTFDHIEVQPCVSESAGDECGNAGAILRPTCEFAPKKYHGFGAALFVGGGDVQITHSIFTHNVATEAAGAVFQDRGAIDILFTTMESNRALKYGGAIFSENGHLHIFATSFIANGAGQYGGAIMLYPSSSGSYRFAGICRNGRTSLPLRVPHNCGCRSCTADWSRAVSATDLCENFPESCTQSTFERNVADAGGAIFAVLANTDVLNLVDVAFKHNEATASGASVMETLGVGLLRARRCKFQYNTNSGSSEVRFGSVQSDASTVALRTPSEFIDCEFIGQRFEGSATSAGAAALIGSSLGEEVIFQECSFSSNEGRFSSKSIELLPRDQSTEISSWLTVAVSSMSDEVSDSVREALQEQNRCRDSNGDEWNVYEDTVKTSFRRDRFCERGYGCDHSEPTEGLQCKRCEAGQYSKDGKLCRICEEKKQSSSGSSECNFCPTDSHASLDGDRSFCVCDHQYWYDHDNINIFEKRHCVACPTGAICESEDNMFRTMLNIPGYWLNLKTMRAFSCPYDDHGLCITCSVQYSLQSPIAPFCADKNGDRIECQGQNLTKSVAEVFSEMDVDQSGYLDFREIKSSGGRLGLTLGLDALKRMFEQIDQDKDDEVTLAELTEPGYAFPSTGLARQPLLAATCCREGHLGVLCASCKTDWVKAKGVCIPCSKFDYFRLAVVIAAYGLLVVFYWLKAWRLKLARHVDEQCQSCAIGLLLFFFQTANVLNIDLLPKDSGLWGVVGELLSMDLDSAKAKSGMCLSSGEFYVDWAYSFWLPCGMLLSASVLCLITRVAWHKFGTVLASVLSFSTFPMNLHAFSMFFCMDASGEFAEHRNQDGLLKSEEPPEHFVLEVDQSIKCYTKEHKIALAVGACVVLVLLVCVPCAYLRSVRKLLHSAGLLGPKKPVKELELTAEEDHKSRMAFAAADVDGSGMLDEKELADVLEKQTGIRPSRQEMHDLKDRLGFVSSSGGDVEWCASPSAVTSTP